jgi:hypothetical protein
MPRTGQSRIWMSDSNSGGRSIRKGKLDGQGNYRNDALIADNLADVLPWDGHEGGHSVAEAPSVGR